MIPTADTASTGRHAGGPPDNTERYLLQIRNMVAWGLILWLISVAVAVGVGVYIGHHASASASSSCPGTQVSIQLTGC